MYICVCVSAISCLNLPIRGMAAMCLLKHTSRMRDRPSLGRGVFSVLSESMFGEEINISMAAVVMAHYRLPELCVWRVDPCGAGYCVCV